jgi:uncharacterized membrane protein YkvA (DUF1232 family)
LWWPAASSSIVVQRCPCDPPSRRKEPFLFAGALISLGVTLAVMWLLFALAVAAGRPAGQSVTAMARMLPEVVGLMRRLATDRSLPRTVRWRLWVAVAYNLQPLNLIPDFVPVVGLADNAVVICWALRSAVRTAGPHVVARHWRGPPERLALLYSLARLGPPPAIGRGGGGGTPG